MARIDDVKRDDLSPRQQQLHDDFLKSRPRATLTGPFSVLIHTPDIAEPADHLVNYYRTDPKLGRRLIELIILMLCRSATVQYAWSVHEPHALKEGITQDVIDAIRARKRPDFKRDDERLIYDFVTDTPAGPVVSVEYLKFREGRIASSLLVFERQHWPEVMAELQKRQPNG